MIFGYCVVCRADVPMSVDGLCAAGEHPLTPGIPPTWGNHTWRWDKDAGTWSPYKPRPDGWAWKDPVDPALKLPKPASPPRQKKPPTVAYTPPRTLTCEQCGSTFSTIQRGGTGARFCGRTCKRAHYKQRGVA